MAWRYLTYIWLHAENNGTGRFLAKIEGQEDYGLCNSIWSLSWLGWIDGWVEGSMIKKINDYRQEHQFYTGMFMWPLDLAGAQERAQFSKTQADKMPFLTEKETWAYLGRVWSAAFPNEDRLAPKGEWVVKVLDSRNLGLCPCICDLRRWNMLDEKCWESMLEKIDALPNVLGRFKWMPTREGAQQRIEFCKTQEALC